MLLCGAGGYNYHRNLQAEAVESEPRPFSGYGDADLAALAEAYRGEVATWEQRQRSIARTSGGGTARKGTLIDERVRDFERTQKRSGALRGVTAEIATREHRLAEIEAEQQRRAEDPTGFALHWKRLVTL